MSNDDAGPETPIQVAVTGFEENPRYFGPDRIQNGGFENDADKWVVGPQTEIGGGGTIAVSGGTAPHLLISASEAPKPGSLYAYQVIPVDAGNPYRLRYDAVDTGVDPSEVRLIMRQKEAGGKTVDSTFAHTLSPIWKTYSWSWTPTTSDSTATLFLRILVNAGQQHSVGFDNVTLRLAPTISWTAVGGTILEASGPQATITFPNPGKHTIRTTGRLGNSDLWAVEKEVTVVNHPPVASLQTSGKFVTTKPILLDAAGSSDPDGVRFADPDFHELGKSWKTVSAEVAPASFKASRTLRDGNSTLELVVRDSTKAGSVYASQRIQLPTAAPLSVAVQAKDDGNISNYALILRERNRTASADTTATFPSSTNLQTLSVSWSPKTISPTSLEVYLRFTMPSAASAKVEFSQPLLIRGLEFKWTIDGKDVGTTTAPVYSYLEHYPGSHHAVVEATDTFGAKDTANLSFSVLAPEVYWDVAAPALVPLGIPIPFDLGTTSREGEGNLVRNAEFLTARDWSLGAGEIAGNTSWMQLEEDGRRFARIDAASAKAGSVYLSQTLKGACADLDCDFTVEYRGSTNARLEPIIRTVFENGTTTDVTAKHPVAGDWQTLHLNYRAPADPAVKTQIFLRFQVAANETASVDFADPALVPRLATLWGFLGPGWMTAQGSSIEQVFREPGAYRVSVTVSDAWGVSGTREQSVTAIPLQVFRTIGGGLGVRRDHADFTARNNLTLAVVDVDGRTLWAQPLHYPGTVEDTEDVNVQAVGNDLLITPSAASPSDALRLVIRNSTTSSVIPLAWTEDRQEVANRTSKAYTHKHLGPLGYLKVDIDTQDETADHLRITVKDGNRTVATRQLDSNNGRFEGRIRLPLELASAHYDVTYEVTNSFGETLTWSETDALSLGARNSAVGFGGVILLGGGALGAGFIVRRKKLQPRKPSDAQGIAGWQSTQTSSTSSPASSSSSPAHSSGHASANFRPVPSGPTASQRSLAASSSSLPRGRNMSRTSSSSGSRQPSPPLPHRGRVTNGKPASTSTSTPSAAPRPSDSSSPSPRRTTTGGSHR